MKLKIFFIIPLTIICLASCQHKTENVETKVPTLSAELQKLIVTDSVRTEPLTASLSLFSKISVDQDNFARIFPLSSGQVLSVEAMLGTYVKKGQVLATIRSNELTDFQNQYTQAQNNLVLAQKNESIAEDLYKTNVYAERDLLSAKSDLKKAEADLERVKKLFEIYNAKVGSTKSQYDVTATIDGYVVEKNITPNMMVRTDNGNDLFAISPLRKVWVLADVYESDVQNVKIGQQAEITTLAYPGKIFYGTIELISSVIDPNSHTMKIKIVLDNEDGLLKPQMFATVNINSKQTKQGLFIPSSALIFDHSQYYVLVYHSNDKIDITEVQKLYSIGNKTYISSGVKVGDKVISSSALQIYSELNN